MSYTIENYHLGESVKFNLFENCYISDFLRKGNIWEPHLHKIFEEYITNNSTVVEAGCHIGTHSIKLSKLAKKLYCFEPLKVSNALLRENLKLNNCINTTVYDEGVSSKITTTKFSWVSLGNPGASGLENNPMGGFENTISNDHDYDVNLTTIDSLNLPELHFIKLDVEGYETKAIEGSLYSIKKHKPIIALECWEDHQGNASVEHTTTQFKFLLNLGYKLSRISNCDWLFLPV